MMSPEDRERVARAVRKAEAGLSAEIVTAAYSASDSYPEAAWAGAAAAVAASSVALLAVDLTRPVWVPFSTMILWVPVAGTVGAVLGRFCSPLRRLLIGRGRLRARAEARAKELFFDRGLAGASRREAVLIFVSLLEKRAVVVAEEGVRAKVPAESWRPAVDALTAAAAEGRVADGLVAAVEKVAGVLRAQGFAGSGGANALGDEPIEDGR